MRKSAGFAPQNRPKHPKMVPKAEKHAISDTPTSIFWTQTTRPSKMKELNKALEAIGDKSPPVTADVQQMRSDLQNPNALAEK